MLYRDSITGQALFSPHMIASIRSATEQRAALDHEYAQLLRDRYGALPVLLHPCVFTGVSASITSYSLPSFQGYIDATTGQGES